MIRLANLSDLTRILEILNRAVINFKDEGIDQWQNGYPSEESFIKDIDNNYLYVYLEDGEILGFFAYILDDDINYHELNNFYSNKSAFIHRIAVDSFYLKKGIASKMFLHIIDMAKNDMLESIKIDTHHDNIKMLGLIKKFGFTYRGYLKSINREAFELIIKEGEN